MLQLPGLARFKRVRQPKAAAPAPAAVPAAPQRTMLRTTYSLTEAQVWTLRNALDMAGEHYNTQRQIKGMQTKVIAALEREEAEVCALAELVANAVLISVTVSVGKEGI